MLVLMATNLSAQSVTISQDKLNELIAILQDYGKITDNLQALSDSYDKRTTSLEAGFQAYKQVVDTELLPKAKAQETEIVWLKVGLGVSLSIDAVTLVYLGGHVVHLW